MQNALKRLIVSLDYVFFNIIFFLTYLLNYNFFFNLIFIQTTRPILFSTLSKLESNEFMNLQFYFLVDVLLVACGLRSRYCIVKNLKILNGLILNFFFFFSF
jgi:Leucine-rich repeat (LRR) protein